MESYLFLLFFNLLLCFLFHLTINYFIDSVLNILFHFFWVFNLLLLLGLQIGYISVQFLFYLLFDVIQFLLLIYLLLNCISIPLILSLFLFVSIFVLGQNLFEVIDGVHGILFKPFGVYSAFSTADAVTWLGVLQESVDWIEDASLIRLEFKLKLLFELGQLFFCKDGF